MAAQVWDGTGQIVVVQDVDPTNPANQTSRNVSIGWVHHWVDGSGVSHEYWQLLDNTILGTLSWDGGGSGQTRRVLQMNWLGRNSSYDGSASSFQSACRSAHSNAPMLFEAISFTRTQV